jgi:hypothetical protein
LPSRCPCKPKPLLISTRHGCAVCKNHSKPKKFCLAVNSIYSRTIFQICKKDFRNAKNYSKPISKENVNYSHVSTLFPILIYSRSSHKALSPLPFKKTLKNYLMLSIRCSSANRRRREAVIRQSPPLFSRLEVLKKYPWLLT